MTKQNKQTKFRRGRITPPEGGGISLQLMMQESIGTIECRFEKNSIALRISRLRIITYKLERPDIFPETQEGAKQSGTGKRPHILAILLASAAHNARQQDDDVWHGSALHM